MNYAIDVRNVTKRYDDFMLDHVSFQVPRGSIVGFVGENGAGKSTTIRAILDLITLEDGEIEVLGLTRSQRRDPSWKERIGVVFDTGHIPDLLNAGQVGQMMGQLYRQWDSGVYEGYLKKFRLPLNKKYKDFSRGMKMKLSLAVALSHGAELLIMDEATSGLDPIIRDELLDIFLDFIQEETHSMLISSHIVSDLEKVADYIVFIHEGRICFQEEKDYLLEHYGLVHCTKEQAETLPESLVLGRRINQFGCDVMVKDRQEVSRRFRELSVDPANIEEIMLYTIKEARV